MRTQFLISTIVASSLLAFAPALQAQVDTLEVPLGSRVRVKTLTVPDIWRTGTVESWNRDTLELTAEGTWSRSIPLPELVSLEISRGSRRNTGKGALAGGIAGAAFGTISSIAIAVADPIEGAGFGTYAAYTVGTAAIGAGIGALIGSLVQSERWEKVPVLPKRDSRVRSNLTDR
jgi:hypothetical protein